MWSDVDYKGGLEKSVETFRKSLFGIRTGRASAGLIESIVVEVYGGQKMKVIQLGTIDVTSERTLTVRPFDKATASAIEKAVIMADIGLSATVEAGNVIVNVPKMSEEIRKDLARNIKKMAEDAKVIVRNHRRDEMDRIKVMQKNKEISEDMVKRYSDQIQKATDGAIGTVDKLAEEKMNSLMVI